MKNGRTIGLLMLLITLLAIGFIDAGKKRPIDWTHTFNQRDKIPYGLYIAREEFSNLLPKGARVKDFSEDRATAISSLLSKPTEKSLVFIVDQFDFSSAYNQHIYQFAHAGGEVFISANSLPKEFLDSLAMEVKYLEYSKFEKPFSNIKLPFFLTDKKNKAFYKDLEYPGLFSKLDAQHQQIVGSFSIERHEIPNFVEVRVGAGKIWVHLEPLMFANFYMLQRPNYQYVATALQVLSHKQVYWYDAYKSSEVSTTPLRFLLVNSGLKQAWYLVLAGLLLFLLFRSKREQKAVRVVIPEANQSKNFAKTIASLYYEQADPGNMLDKKIDYFLYDLRRYYQLDSLKLEEESFSQWLSMKSGVPMADTGPLVVELLQCKAAVKISIEDLKRVVRRIEEFKIKAQMV